MPKFHFSYERVLNAPAATIYHCLADYDHHHRAADSGGFLPPTFTVLDVLQGGVGAGTVIRFTTKFGGRSATRTQTVFEPEPGHVLVENGGSEGTIFTVEARGDRTLVRFDTTLQLSGLEAMVMPLLGSRILGPLYADEMSRLEAYAQAHAPHEATIAAVA
jgi:hypothetical protein